MVNLLGVYRQDLEHARGGRLPQVVGTSWPSTRTAGPTPTPSGFGPVRRSTAPPSGSGSTSVTGRTSTSGAPLAAAHVLPVPLPSARHNVAGALEQLGGRLTVAVRRGPRTVWTGETDLAGLEHAGLERAAAELARRGAAPGAYAAPPLKATTQRIDTGE